MNNKGSFELGPIQRAETRCDKPILTSEIRKYGFRSRILTLLLPIFLAATGCAAGKTAVLAKDNPKPPDAAAKKTTGKTPVPKKPKGEKDQAAKELRQKTTPTMPSEGSPEDDEWKEVEKMIRKLNREEEYWKCWEEDECGEV